MEFQEYMKIKRRMVKYNLKMRACMEDCGECAFHTQNNGLKCHCSDVELIDPELAENIVKQWAKEHCACGPSSCCTLQTHADYYCPYGAKEAYHEAD